MPASCSFIPVLLRFRWLLAGLLGTGSLLLTTTAPPAAAARPYHLATRRPAAPDDSVAYYLRGRVFDAYTQEPLPFASLWLKRLGQGTQTDEQGYFVFALTWTQLDSALTDTLQAQSLAFRLQARPVRFQVPPADTMLQIVLARDSAVKISPPLLVQPARRRSRAGAATAAPGAAAAQTVSAPPRRTFWQRLFGGR